VLYYSGQLKEGENVRSRRGRGEGSLAVQKCWL
jgi:hypothetical protein